LNRQLTRQDERYQSLKTLEMKGEDVQERMILLLQEIVQSLQQLEGLYQQLLQTPEIRENLQVVKEKQRMFEQARFDQLKRQFIRKYETYKQLKQQERTPTLVKTQVIPVLQQLIETLAGLKTIDDSLLNEFPEILRELQEFRNVYTIFQAELEFLQKLSQSE